MSRSRLFAAVCLLASVCLADDPPITGPLTAPHPIPIGGETMPSLSVNGVVSGIGLWQSNPAPGDASTRATVSNGEIFLRKTDGWWQFFVQAGAYDFPSLGLPFLSTEDTVRELYGPVPVAYLKLVPRKDTAILIGSLPGLVGAEAPFTFQNLNVQRGLLWNQENTVNRGVQVNQTIGKLTASISWNDGYYSNRYSWLSGSLTYASGAHSFSFQAMGNLSQTAFRTLATPIQNNSRLYAAVYTYSKGSWIVQPYFQNTTILSEAGSTRGAALLLSRSLGRGFALAGRAEYLRSAGAVNLLYGPRSSAWSATVTPTFQAGRFFVRGDLAIVRANSVTPGYAFGAGGNNRSQPRAIVEAGILF